MSKNILLLPGDGIGPEIVQEAVKVLDKLNDQFSLGIHYEYDLMGGCSIDKHGVPLADETIANARKSDGILLGAVGGPKWDTLDRAIRPEKGLLKIRSELDLFSNLRPAAAAPVVVFVVVVVVGNR